MKVYERTYCLHPAHQLILYFYLDMSVCCAYIQYVHAYVRASRPKLIRFVRLQFSQISSTYVMFRAMEYIHTYIMFRAMEYIRTYVCTHLRV